MRIHLLVKRLAAHVALLASLVFALGLWPRGLIASACEQQGMSQFDDDDDVVDQNALALQESDEASLGTRKVRRAAATAPCWAASLTAPVFTPPQRVARGPTLVLYKTFLRLRC